MKWYNDKTMMAPFVATLELFHQLLDARAQARENKDEPLDCFVVRGAWYLDQFGQCAQIGNVQRYDEQTKHYHTIELQHIPDILTRDEFVALLPKGTEWSYGFGGGTGLPDHNLRCSCCGGGWHMANTNDNIKEHDSEVLSGQPFIGQTLLDFRRAYENRSDGYYYFSRDSIVRNDRWIDLTPGEYGPLNERGWADASEHKRAGRPHIDWDTYVIQEGDEIFVQVSSFYHRDCFKRKQAQKTREQMRIAVEAAGFKVLNMTDMENTYGSELYNGPWQQIKTDKGVINAGWRNSVINVDFSQIAPKLVVADDVTKGEGYAHAHGYKKMFEYLDEVRKAA